jgi:hypothetical protein
MGSFYYSVTSLRRLPPADPLQTFLALRVLVVRWLGSHRAARSVPLVLVPASAQPATGSEAVPRNQTGRSLSGMD